MLLSHKVLACCTFQLTENSLESSARRLRQTHTQLRCSVLRMMLSKTTGLLSFALRTAVLGMKAVWACLLYSLFQVQVLLQMPAVLQLLLNVTDWKRASPEKHQQC